MDVATGRRRMIRRVAPLPDTSSDSELEELEEDVEQLEEAEKDGKEASSSAQQQQGESNQPNVAVAPVAPVVKPREASADHVPVLSSCCSLLYCFALCCVACCFGCFAVSAVCTNIGKLGP